MKVVLINHSDTRGGASVVTVRLMHALRSEGVDARMLVMHKATDDPNIALVGNALSRKASFAYEHLDIFTHNGFSKKNLFKTSIGKSLLPIHNHPWVKQADVVVLNWVNQGMVGLDDIAKIQAPVVWTMHDMWNLTGVCHHAEECISYMRECGNCRLLYGGTHPHDLSRTTHERKQALYTAKPISFVAVSNWLAKKCAQSSLLKHKSVSVIPNAFPVDEFRTTPIKPRSAYGLPEGRQLVVMGAARLDDPIKGLDLAIEALNKLKDMNVTAVFFGAIRNQHALDSLKIPYLTLGTVTSHEMLNDIYAHAQCVLSTSSYETLPGTLIEGMAAGCVPVTFGYGGQPDIVDHLSTGYIAIYRNADDVSEGIRYALSGKISREKMRQAVTQKFAAQKVALQYISLFDSLIKKP